MRMTRSRRAVSSNFDQGIGSTGRLLDRNGYIVDRRAARRAALIAAVMGVAVNHSADFETVDGFAETR